MESPTFHSPSSLIGGNNGDEILAALKRCDWFWYSCLPMPFDSMWVTRETGLCFR